MNDLICSACKGLEVQCFVFAGHLCLCIGVPVLAKSELSSHRQHMCSICASSISKEGVSLQIYTTQKYGHWREATSCSMSHGFSVTAVRHSNSTSGEAAFLEECHGVQGVARASMIPLVPRLLTLLASVGLSVGNVSDVQRFLVGRCGRTN